MARGPSIHSIRPGDGGVSGALCPAPRQARCVARFLDHRTGGNAPGLRAPFGPAVARRQAQLARLGVKWAPWMERVMLYYYYPEKLNGSARWVRELAEVLVACEQFEAYSNRQRGRDYYTRKKESLPEAFAYLDKLQVEGILSPRVVQTVRELAAEGAFDKVLADARGATLPCWELWFLRSLKRVGW